MAPEDETVVLHHFTNLSGEVGLDWVGLGIVETLRAELADDGFKFIDSDSQAWW